MILGVARLGGDRLKFKLYADSFKLGVEAILILDWEREFPTGCLGVIGSITRNRIEFRGGGAGRTILIYSMFPPREIHEAQ